jgi:hypothetical protein
MSAEIKPLGGSRFTLSAKLGNGTVAKINDVHFEDVGRVRRDLELAAVDDRLGQVIAAFGADCSEVTVLGSLWAVQTAGWSVSGRLAEEALRVHHFAESKIGRMLLWSKSMTIDELLAALEGSC